MKKNFKLLYQFSLLIILFIYSNIFLLGSQTEKEEIEKLLSNIPREELTSYTDISSNNLINKPMNIGDIDYDGIDEYLFTTSCYDLKEKYPYICKLLKNEVFGIFNKNFLNVIIINPFYTSTYYIYAFTHNVIGDRCKEIFISRIIVAASSYNCDSPIIIEKRNKGFYVHNLDKVFSMSDKFEVNECTEFININDKTKLLKTRQVLQEWPPWGGRPNIKTVGTYYRNYIMDFENLKLTKISEKLDGRLPYDLLPNEEKEKILEDVWGVKRRRENIIVYKKKEGVKIIYSEIKLTKSIDSYLDFVYKTVPVTKELIKKNEFLDVISGKKTMDSTLNLIKRRALNYGVKESIKRVINNIYPAPIFEMAKSLRKR